MMSSEKIILPMSRFNYIYRSTTRRNSWSGQFLYNITSTTILNLDLADIRREITAVFERMLNDARTRAGLTGRDRMQISINDRGSGFSVSTRLMLGLSGLYILDLLERLIQSSTDFQIERCDIYIVYTKSSVGGGYFETALSVSEFVKRKTYIIDIISENENCFIQCLILGLAQHDSIASYRKIMKKHEGRRKNLINRANSFPIQHRGGVTMKDVRIYEKEYELRILVVDIYSMKTIYKGNSKYKKYICMLQVRDLDDETKIHYHYVNKDHIGSLWANRKYCLKCCRAYQDIRHGCIEKCKACGRNTCDGSGKSDIFVIKCDTCNLHFYDIDCFNYHMIKLCSREKKCLGCKKIYKVEKKYKHVCGEYKCRNCKLSVMFGHQCYHQTINDETPLTDKYIFYDYETCLDEKNNHVIVLVVAMYYDKEDVFVFTENNEFINWLFREEHKEYTVIAHNGGKYDFHFIKREMIRKRIVSQDVCNGNTIFYSYCKKFKLTFLDSYRLIPIGLRGFPKAFGIKELCKGFFPYRYINKQNMHELIFELPDMNYYEFEKMKSHDMEQGIKWYNANKQLAPTTIFDICREYCISDVKVLKEGCIKFRKIFLEISQDKVDPLQCITIASCCMKLYRTIYLKQDLIAVLPLPNEDMDRKLNYLKEKYNVIKEDGYKLETKDEIIELLNCLDNGCIRCFKKTKIHPNKYLKMYELYYKWKNQTYEKPYMGIWQCELNITKGELPLDILYMRDGFYGGRTEVFKTYFKCKPNQRIRYIDYNSLYPSVQSGEFYEITDDDIRYINGKRDIYFPVGFPEIIKPECFHNWKEYFGFIKCKMTPPKNLYLPLLPSKRNNKLMFDLYPKIGTWTSIEIQKAVELGYRIDKIYSIVHFPEKSNELFKEYVNTFIAKKIEAGGKDKYETKEELNKFIYDCQLRGITIDIDKMESNPAMYFAFKLCLNNLWGKYAQRVEYKNVVDIYSLKSFEEYIENDDLEIVDIILHDTIARTITYETKHDLIKVPGYTNIAIAAYVTAHARLRLYEAMEIAGNHLLYTDTDSLLYWEYIDYPLPLKIGNHLGDLGDEISKDDHIIEFVSIAPKSYAYITKNGKTCCKVKGITLNHVNEAKINFNSLKRIVCDTHDEHIEAETLQFKIDKQHQITTDDINNKKIVKYTFNKRRIIDDDNENMIDSKPFG